MTLNCLGHRVLRILKDLQDQHVFHRLNATDLYRSR